MPYFMKNQRIEHALFDDLLSKGEQRQVALPDGSHIMLNTDTKLSVLISERTRSVSLDRGEAWFTVQHDEHRPFRIHVANGSIHDLGTEFIVKKVPEKVQVSVVEGGSGGGIKGR